MATHSNTAVRPLVIAFPPYLNCTLMIRPGLADTDSAQKLRLGGVRRLQTEGCKLGQALTVSGRMPLTRRLNQLRNRRTVIEQGKGSAAQVRERLPWVDA